MIFAKKELSNQLKKQLKDYVYDILGCIFLVYRELACRYPEYVYQEALSIVFHEKGISYKKEYAHHPIFMGKPLSSFFKMDLIVERSRGNIIIECKAIDSIGEKERHQLFTYLTGTQYPIGIIVNFSTYPKAEVEKYYYDKNDGTITPF